MAARDRAARTAEVGGATAAAGVGSALGYTKLRDAYKRDFGSKDLERGIEHVERVVPKASRLTRALSHGEPGFVPLAIGAGGATVATAASRYRKHRQKAPRPSAPSPAKTDFTKGMTMTSSAFGVDHGELDIAKGLNDKPPQSKALRAVGDASASVNKLRHKIAPTGPDLIKLADSKVVVVRNRVANIGKAFDAKEREKKHAKRAEGLLASGGMSSLGYSTVQRKAGMAAKRRASKQEANSARYTGEATAHTGQATAHMGAMHHARVHEKGRGLNANAFLEAKKTSQRAGYALGNARDEAIRAANNTKAATGHLRVARNYRVGGAAMLGGAYLAHRYGHRAN